MDGLVADVNNYSGDYLCTMLKNVIQKYWHSKLVPLHLGNATVAIQYKGKGEKDVSDNYPSI